MPWDLRAAFQERNSSVAGDRGKDGSNMDDCFLRLKTVISMTGLPRSSLYRMISEGRFPRQVPLSRRAVGWRASAVHRWLDDPSSYTATDKT